MIQDNQDFPAFRDSFLGLRTALPTSLTLGYPWKITDTSSSGSPTYTFVNPSTTGEAKVTLASTSEVENVCLDWGDVLAVGVGNLKKFKAIVKCSAISASVTFAFGIQSARNDDTDATAINAQFKLAGSNSILCETDDGTTDTDDQVTGVSLSTTYKKFEIDFSDLSNVKFSVDNVRVCPTVKFDMSAASLTAGVQPFFQIQKTASTAVDNFTLDDVILSTKRV